jgi:hypothetical protein
MGCTSVRAGLLLLNDSRPPSHTVLNILHHINNSGLFLILLQSAPDLKPNRPVCLAWEQEKLDARTGNQPDFHSTYTTEEMVSKIALCTLISCHDTSFNTPLYIYGFAVMFLCNYFITARRGCFFKSV